MLSLHDLFKIDDMSDISDNKKFVLASSHINVHLVQSNVLFVHRTALFIIQILENWKFKGGSLFVLSEELPNVC